MMLGQIAEQVGEVEVAREAYAKGAKACPSSVPLWTLSAQLEQKTGVLYEISLVVNQQAAGFVTKARALLEKARQKNTANEALW